MYTLYSIILPFLTLLSISNASPLNASCTVYSYNDVSAALSSCLALIIKDMTVPAGKTLKLALKDGSSVTFEGTITFAHHNWDGPLLEISGHKVAVTGAPGSQLNGLGEQYWDGQGDSGVKKPKFFKLKTTGGSLLRNINMFNCPRQCVSISASNTVIDKWYIDVSAGDYAGGKNTDGFDLSLSNGVTIQNSVVKNQDDCIAINQGHDFIFKNIACIGGHGLSLSVGQSTSSGSVNTVSNVQFIDCSVTDSYNGIHIKTHCDAGSGSISNVVYKNIYLSGITHDAINIQQDYEGGKSTGSPSANIPITGLTLNSVSGTMSGVSNCRAVNILCGDNGCSDWKWSGVSISGGQKSNSCNFTPSGFNC